MPNFGGVFGFLSILIFATVRRSAYSFAASSKSGAIILHGPHHSAQKSSSTGLSAFKTSASKLLSLVWTMLSLTGAYLRVVRFEFDSGYVRSGPPGTERHRKVDDAALSIRHYVAAYCRYNRGFTRLLLRCLLEFR